MYRMRKLSWRIGRSSAGTEPTVTWAATRWSATAAGSSRGRPASVEQSRSGPRWVQVQLGAAPHQTQAPAPIHRRVCAESERGGGRRRRKGGRRRTEYGKRRAYERPIASPCAASHNDDAPPQSDVYAAGFPEGPTRGAANAQIIGQIVHTGGRRRLALRPMRRGDGQAANEGCISRDNSPVKYDWVRQCD